MEPLSALIMMRDYAAIALLLHSCALTMYVCDYIHIDRFLCKRIKAEKRASRSHNKSSMHAVGQHHNVLGRTMRGNYIIGDNLSAVFHRREANVHLMLLFAQVEYSQTCRVYLISSTESN